jgi:serine/threonine protein kinase
LTGQNYDVKLTDFGISQTLTKGYGYIYDQNGTLPYCSPELLKGEPYNQKTDVWALGCIIYELCTRKRCFSDYTEEAIRESILGCNVPTLPHHVDKDIKIVY